MNDPKTRRAAKGLPPFDDSGHDPSALFDVTCVIGTVHMGDGRHPTPYHAAMSLIADHDAEGTYRFPLRDGRECAVTVEYGPQPE